MNTDKSTKICVILRRVQGRFCEICGFFSELMDINENIEEICLGFNGRIGLAAINLQTEGNPEPEMWNPDAPGMLVIGRLAKVVYDAWFARV